MSTVYDTSKEVERVILIGVSIGNESQVWECLDELEELSKTAGAEAVYKMIQNREAVHPGTYIGKGKIEELKELIFRCEATGIICDDELSPAQLNNLEEETGIKVIDRTVLILDIFAKHAMTKEGKIQVELAQLKYRSSRLKGLGKSLSRLGGGIGTKGPGEKKLEMDRRLIRDRISQLNKELEQVKQSRDVIRRKRMNSPVPVAAIVGYTNAGKSTLLNKLTNAGVLEEDKLFATLEPSTRNMKLESGQHILLTDTVGFIRKLPHHLINAFRSTLEEAKYADIIIHVVDSSNGTAESQMETVYETLKKLEVKDKVNVTVFNKQDKNCSDIVIKDMMADYTVKISARTGDNIEDLLDVIEGILRERRMLLDMVFEYKDAGIIQRIRKYGQLLEENYTDQGISVKAYIPLEIFNEIRKKYNI